MGNRKTCFSIAYRLKEGTGLPIGWFEVLWLIETALKNNKHERYHSVYRDFVAFRLHFVFAALWLESVSGEHSAVNGYGGAVGYPAAAEYHR